MIRPVLLGIFLALVILIGETASAADLHDPNNTSSDLLDLVRNTSNQWSVRLRSYAERVFLILITIDLVWKFAPMVMKRATGEQLLSEFVIWLVKTVIFLTLLTQSVQLGQAIIDSFRQAGADAAGMPAVLQPGDMFTLAVSMSNTVSSIDTWNPGKGMLIMLSAFTILICFTFIAVFMFVTLVESYVAVNIAVFFMGFGGAAVSREYALNWVKYSFSVGAKLLVLTLIVGLIMSVSRDWQASYKHDSASTLTLVGLALLCAILTKTIPDQVQSLIMGTSMGGGSVLGGMAAAGMALGAAAASAVSMKFAQMGIMNGGSSGSGFSSVVNSLSGGSDGGVSSLSGGSQPPSSGSSGSSFSAPASSSTGSPGGFKAKAAGAAHAATAGAARVVGTMASISVPGMEGVENLSVGPSPVSSAPPSFEAPKEDTPENIIRPEDKKP